MNDGYIALLDSGIGGLSVLNQLLNILPNEKYIYFGDNQNAPYGNKSLSELKRITFKNIDYIKQYNIKLLVVACNTLSVNLINDITAYSGLKTFGVFPPVEQAIIKSKRSLLLATERTAQIYREVKGLTAIGLKTLAKDIEDNKFKLNSFSIDKAITMSSGKYVNTLGYYDSIILGCTHYFFIKNKIFDHFRPQKIIFGEKFTADAVKNFIKNKKSLENYKQNELLFIGENAKTNQDFFSFYSKNFINL